MRGLAVTIEPLFEAPNAAVGLRQVPVRKAVFRAFLGHTGARFADLRGQAPGGRASVVLESFVSPFCQQRKQVDEGTKNQVAGSIVIHLCGKQPGFVGSYRAVGSRFRSKKRFRRKSSPE